MVNVLKELGSHLECTEKKRVFLIKRQNVNSINGANEKDILWWRTWKTIFDHVLNAISKTLIPMSHMIYNDIL